MRSAKVVQRGARRRDRTPTSRATSPRDLVELLQQRRSDGDAVDASIVRRLERCWLGSRMTSTPGMRPAARMFRICGGRPRSRRCRAATKWPVPISMLTSVIQSTTSRPTAAPLGILVSRPMSIARVLLVPWGDGPRSHVQHLGGSAPARMATSTGWCRGVAWSGPRMPVIGPRDGAGRAW